MYLLKLNPLVYFSCIIVAAIPAYYLNRWLLFVIRPRESGWRLAAYFISAVFLAFAYTGMVSFVLFRWVWPLR